MDRTGSAAGTGGIKDGSGVVATETGALKDLQYSFASRCESGVGTNPEDVLVAAQGGCLSMALRRAVSHGGASPEELLGAAHAGCFSMAQSGALNKAGLSPEKIETTATVTVVPDGGGFTITKVHLDVTVKVDTDDANFQEIAKGAKEGCPVSK